MTSFSFFTCLYLYLHLPTQFNVRQGSAGWCWCVTWVWVLYFESSYQGLYVESVFIHAESLVDSDVVIATLAV